jgi:HAD superfamily hydrolase (TIGR01509 family)
VDFLQDANTRNHQIWCLSNDVSEWSKKLRVRFGLEKYIRGFVISGDVGLRKPDPAIFVSLVGRSRIKPEEAIFVDDSIRNLDAAAKLGFQTMVFDPGADHQVQSHNVATTFGDIAAILS